MHSGQISRAFAGLTQGVRLDVPAIAAGLR